MRTRCSEEPRDEHTLRITGKWIEAVLRSTVKAEAVGGPKRARSAPEGGYEQAATSERMDEDGGSAMNES